MQFIAHEDSLEIRNIPEQASQREIRCHVFLTFFPLSAQRVGGTEFRATTTMFAFFQPGALLMCSLSLPSDTLTSALALFTELVISIQVSLSGEFEWLRRCP